jgi:dTDP-4-amino-4,6-dideoxygalactose transaminase
VTGRHIRLAIPYTDDDEIAEVTSVLRSGYLTQGPKVTELESCMTDLVGTRYAFAMTSATTALHLSLVALGVGPGDEVVVPDFTFPATANVVVQLGARPVLADIDAETLTVDPADLERRISSRTKAVMPVHAFGLTADMDAVNAVAAANGIAVVEDAACAVGATYCGRQAGSLGLLGCFSFHPRKAITTGEGGIITTNDDQLADRIRLLRSHGGVREEGRFTFVDAGFNYRLSDILAAVGVAQFRKLSDIVAAKRSLAQRYADLLASVDGVVVPIEPSWAGHVYQSYVVTLDEAIDRDAVIQTMREAGIETTLGTYALHREPFFVRALGTTEGDLPRSAAAYHRTLALPIYPGLTENDLDRVASSLAAAVKQANRPSV